MVYIRRVSRAVLIVLVVAACAGKRDNAPPPPVMVPADAARDVIAPITELDPETRLDDDDRNGRTPRRPDRQGLPIGIMLKSEPPGAIVLVDGQSLGETPTYWSGVPDGALHEFAFTKPKYGLARYRFVPITSGTLHATLERVDGGEISNAGLAPQIAPKLAPDAALSSDRAVVPPPDAALQAAPADAATPATTPSIDGPQTPRPKHELVEPSSLGPKR